MNSAQAIFLDEPELQFGFAQTARDPKQGLFLFGPLRDGLMPLRIRVGVVGTAEGLRLYTGWVRSAGRPISPPVGSTTSVFYPGFRELFGCEWPESPDVVCPVAADAVSSALRIAERHVAVFRTVSLFVDAISTSVLEEETKPDIWFVVVPDEVYAFARPKSGVPVAERTKSETLMNARLARQLTREPSLFDDDMAAAKPFLYDLDFHNQLKVRLLERLIVTQIVRESTLQPESSESRRRLQDAATVAWNMSLSTYYKVGGRPWKVANVRDGVCYVGLVFKKDITGPSEEYACCGAQMFLSGGDGMVFKGRLGDWYSPRTREFHLTREMAREVCSGVVEAFTKLTGSAPRELFVHGKTRFDNDEWAGFCDAVPAGTNVVGVRIVRSDEFKLYRPGRMPVVRGTALIDTPRVAYLWTSGYVPDLRTYPGWETPNPLRVEISRGEAAIEVVVRDVLMLTKLNFNSCIYGDGLPVTLRFADAVGEILTSAPDVPSAPLPFRHYI
jgi:hypothetical protein